MFRLQPIYIGTQYQLTLLDRGTLELLGEVRNHFIMLKYPARCPSQGKAKTPFSPLIAWGYSSVSVVSTCDGAAIFSRLKQDKVID